MNTKLTFTTALIIVFALVLAGCGGEPSPTPQPPTAEVSPTSESLETAEFPTSLPLDEPTPEPTVNSPFPTLEIPVYPTIVETPFPTPDLAIPPQPTEELSAPTTGFDKIILIRTGGPTLEDGTTADELIILDRADMSITRGDTRGTLSESAAQRIGDLVDAAEFFTVDGVFLGAVPAEPPLPFLYSITVNSGGLERTINAQEGYMTPPIQSLVGAVFTEGQRVPRP